MVNFYKDLTKLINMLEKKFVLQQSGIGDVIIFLSWISQTINSKTPVFIDFDKNNIQTWREDPQEYYSFLVNLANFLIPSENIVVKEGLDGKKISIEEIFAYYPAYFIDFRFMDLRPKLNIEWDLDQVVINTKVRGLGRHHYNAIKNRFYQALNNSNKKFIVMGEKEIEYGKEYKLHGENAIYSIYNDVITNLPKERITDITVPKLGITLPSLDNIKSDINIIAKHKSLCFGSSGIVSLCCCSAIDTRSCIPDNENFSRFLDSHHVQLKGPDAFINDLPNFLS